MLTYPIIVTLSEFHNFSVRNLRDSPPTAKFCTYIVALLLFFRYKMNLLGFYEEVENNYMV